MELHVHSKCHFLKEKHKQKMQSASFIAFSSTVVVAGFASDAGFLCKKADVIEDTIKETPLI